MQQQQCFLWRQLIYCFLKSGIYIIISLNPRNKSGPLLWLQLPMVDMFFLQNGPFSCFSLKRVPLCRLLEGDCRGVWARFYFCLIPLFCPSSHGLIHHQPPCPITDWLALHCKSAWVSGSTARIDMPRWWGMEIGGGSVHDLRDRKLGSNKNGTFAQTPRQSPSRSLHREAPFQKKNKKNTI